MNLNDLNESCKKMAGKYYMTEYLRDYLTEHGMHCRLFPSRDILINFGSDSYAIVRLTDSYTIEIFAKNVISAHPKNRIDIHDPNSFPEVLRIIKSMIPTVVP